MKIAAVRQYALGLTEVTEAPHFNYSSFRVCGKIFVTVPPAETHIHVFVGEEEREQALVLHPEFVEKLFWGAKALGLRVELAKAQPAVVKRIMLKAWEAKAPKTLLAKTGAK